jgi:hypothetical protein
MSNNILSQPSLEGQPNKFRVCPSSKHILSRDTHTLKDGTHAPGGDGDALSYISEASHILANFSFRNLLDLDNATTTNDNPLHHCAAAQSSW